MGFGLTFKEHSLEAFSWRECNGERARAICCLIRSLRSLNHAKKQHNYLGILLNTGLLALVMLNL